VTHVLRIDEAMNTIGMISEWLELDSPDDGVRYDSEIVSH
jgi:type II protein arginine methyltransferase